MLGEEFNHKAIEQPGLFDLAGMAGARQRFQLAIRNELLQRERPLVAVVLAAGQNNGRTADGFMMILGIRLREGFELVDDRFYVGVLVAFRKQIRKKVRQRSGAK